MVHPQSFFDEKLKGIDFSQNLLPFFHSCDAFFFRSILMEKKLHPLNCTVFENEKLLYLFYGRPAYKSSNNASSGLNALLPVCFIVKADAIESIKRIAPFDTGAYNIGLYKEYMHPKMEMKHFFLTPHKTSICKVISYFFETNERYYNGRPKREVEFDSMDFELQSYFELIKRVGQSKTDDRKASIEVQLCSELQLSADTIEAIIMPEIFIQSKVVEDIVVNELKAEVITYESYGIPSDLYYSEILSLTKNYLVRKEYMYARKSIL